jgi:hypothetical protein
MMMAKPLALPQYRVALGRRRLLIDLPSSAEIRRA